MASFNSLTTNTSRSHPTTWGFCDNRRLVAHPKLDDRAAPAISAAVDGMGVALETLRLADRNYQAEHCWSSAL
jgi:hypothetical protein